MSERDFPTLRAPGVQPKINSIFDFTSEVLGQLRLWLEMNPPSIPVQQVLGFTQFIAQRATVATSETTTSLTFADLTTAGPTLSGLPKGTYLVIVTAAMSISIAGNAAVASPSVNGATPIDSDGAITANANVGTHVGVSLQTLPTDNNTIKMKYRAGPGTGTFFYRNLIALKVAN